jgi:hypothetical protein
MTERCERLKMTNDCLDAQAPAGPHLNEYQVAAHLQMSVQWVRKNRYAGKGPLYRKFGNRVRYHIDDLLAYEAQSVRSSTSQSDG